MNKKVVFVLLFSIVLIASLLRLWQLESVPISPDWDEAALGYNAYSILHTGRDEYGKFLPIVLRSFDDYKPALYSYLVIPSIQLFGLSVFSVRFPAAVFGILAVLATYFLVKELLKDQKLALLSSFVLAISPWHIQFSHVAFEASVGMAFNLFSAVFFLKGLKKPWYLFLSVFCISLGMYVYQSEKVFAPLFFLTLIIIYRKQLFAISRKYLITACIFGLLITLPLLLYTITNKDALARARGVSVLSESTTFLKLDAGRILYDRTNKDPGGLLFDNRRFVFAKVIIANYISHFDLNWLFITGDISRHHAPGMGLLYFWELPFLLVGMYQLLFGDFDKKARLFLIIWFFLVPIPAAVTTGVPHAVRTLNFLPLFQIASALGLVTVYKAVSSSKVSIPVKNSLFVIFGCIFLFNFSYYLNQYFVQQNYYNAVDWQYGYAKAVPEVQNVQRNYKKVVVSNKPYMDQSYMFFLFYLQYPPALYQSQSQYASGGFRENHTFGKYEFRPIDWEKDSKEKNVLYIGRNDDFPSQIPSLKTVYLPNNQPAMKIVGT